MSDQHRADVAGFAGDPLVATPTLDWLAEEGVVFDSAYTPSPICIPARQCFAAGQFPRTCGVEAYGQDLPTGSMTWARRFALAGYDTVACGKLHHMGPDQMQGWTRRIGMDHQIQAAGVGNGDARVDDAHNAPDNHSCATSWTLGKMVRRSGIGYGPFTAAWDDYATDGCLRYINEMFADPWYDHASPETPVCLYLGLNNPHPPYTTDESLFRRYLSRVEPFVDQASFDHPYLGGREIAAALRIGRDGEIGVGDVRRATAAYYGNVERVDRQFGQVLDALREAGQDLDDWLIVFLSDHGEMLGQYGLWQKRQFFEASVRVPLIVRWPKRFDAARVSGNVSLCDLYATLCELCGLGLPAVEETVRQAGLNSRSLVPLLEGDLDGWRAGHEDEAVSQFGGTNLMIKRGELKYQLYLREDCAGEPEVLFDLARDPGESANLIEDSRYADVLPMLRSRAAALGFVDRP